MSEDLSRNHYLVRSSIPYSERFWIVLEAGFRVWRHTIKSSMLKSIQKAGEQGFNIRRCGGLWIHQINYWYKTSKKVFKMVGLVDARTKMTGDT